MMNVFPLRGSVAEEHGRDLLRLGVYGKRARDLVAYMLQSPPCRGTTVVESMAAVDLALDDEVVLILFEGRSGSINIRHFMVAARRFYDYNKPCTGKVTLSEDVKHTSIDTSLEEIQELIDTIAKKKHSEKFLHQANPFIVEQRRIISTQMKEALAEMKRKNEAAQKAFDEARMQYEIARSRSCSEYEASIEALKKTYIDLSNKVCENDD